MSWFDMMLGAATVAAAPIQYTDPATLPGLQFLLDADTLAGFTLSGTGGDEVSSYVERSANGYTGTQTTAGKRPKRITNGLDGRAVIRFDGTDDHLDFGTSALNLGTGNFTIITIWQKNVSVSGAYSLIGKIDPSGGPGWLVWGETGQPRYFLYGQPGAANMQEYAVDFSGFAVQLFEADRGNFMQSWTNKNNTGGPQYIFTHALQSLNNTKRMLIGAFDDDGVNEFQGYYFNGDIAYIACFNRLLSSQEKTEVYNFLKQRYPSLPYTI